MRRAFPSVWERKFLPLPNLLPETKFWGGFLGGIGRGCGSVSSWDSSSVSSLSSGRGFFISDIEDIMTRLKYMRFLFFARIMRATGSLLYSCTDHIQPETLQYVTENITIQIRYNNEDVLCYTHFRNHILSSCAFHEILKHLQNDCASIFTEAVFIFPHHHPGWSLSNT